MRSRRLARKFRRKGSALMMVMIFITLISFSLMSLGSVATHERTQAARLRIYQDELTAAESATDAVIGQIRFYASNTPRQVNAGDDPIADFDEYVSLPTIEGYELDDDVSGCEIAPNGNPGWQIINDSEDPWYGYTVRRVTYRVRALARATSGNSDRLQHPGVAVERLVDVQYTPLYAYAIFYGNDLELDAGVRLDVIGRVHTNGNFYLTTSSEAYYHNYVTVAKNFYGGYYQPSTGRGRSGSQNIYITTNGQSAPNNTSSMRRIYGRADNPNTYLTSNDIPDYNQTRTTYTDTPYANWVAESTQRFNGYLRDSAHGIQPLGLPIPADVDPHALIEPPSADDSYNLQENKFANQADITITGDPRNVSSIRAVDASGNNIPLVYDPPGAAPPVSIVSTSTIYNGREQKYVDMINIDMGLLNQSGINVGDGIIYVNPTQPTGSTANSRESAVRLTNASVVPTNNQGGLTVATSAPMYTKGDVNTSGNAILLLAADAINTLSNSFNDSSYQTSSQASSPRQASATTTNAIFLTGNVPSAKYPGRYSGGAENFFRYLETWGSSAPHTFNGSLLNLFESKIAIGPWDQNAARGTQSSPYYGAPRRIWSWDRNLAGITPPPGMPFTVNVRLKEWRVLNTNDL